MDEQFALDIMLNGGAMIELGLPLESGAEQIAASLWLIGATVGVPWLIKPVELQN